MSFARGFSARLAGTVLAVGACATPAAMPLASPSPSPVATAIVTASPATPAPSPAVVACTDCWPLSGLPIAAGDVRKRPLVVKVDNAPVARPHYGINKADVVFETLVEGFVTRHAAIFHSREPAVVASVRSARMTDLSIAPMVRGALVYSGTSDYEIPLLAAAEQRGLFADIGATRLGVYYRLNTRPAPSNLASRPADLRAQLARIDPKPVDVPRWDFIAAEHPPTAGGMIGAASATQLTIPYRADRVLTTYRYDAAGRSYARWQNNDGVPVKSVDAETGDPVAAANVIVIYTEVREVPEIVDSGGFVSYNSRLTGGGAASIFRDGLRQDGRWERADDLAPFTFTSRSGERILLAPGQTWVHPIPTDWAVTSQ